jgi:HTH-type transcriptional regulator, sugar sensing transcriptional regulator
LSLERVFKILESFGFAVAEAKVYVYLAKRGPQTAKEITLGMRIPKQKLNPILISLVEKGTVISLFKPVTQFSALSVEKMLDIQVKKTLNQAETIRDAKEKLLSSWQNMETKNNT